jgi:hypothetical protein
LVNKANNLEFGRRKIPEIHKIWIMFKKSKLNQDVMTWHQYVRESLLALKSDMNSGKPDVVAILAQQFIKPLMDFNQVGQQK